MHRIHSVMLEMIAASVFIIPIFCIFGKLFFHNVKRTVLYVVFAFYLVAILSLVGFPSIIYVQLDPSINIIPFFDMISDFKNACLNILLFIPLGVFLPLLWDKYRNIKPTFIVGLCVTCIIEITQIFTLRSTDINDIITNTAGTLIGYFLIAKITKNFTYHTLSNAKNTDLYIICGTVTAIMFFAQPFISSLLWKTIY